MKKSVWWVFLVLWYFCVVSCGSVPTKEGEALFNQAPIVWSVDDQKNIEEPEETEFWLADYFDLFVTRSMTRTLELRTDQPALDTNALDEVPNSSWFTNRIGVRKLTSREMARGSNENGPPELPLVVTKGKVLGGNPGFFVKDRRGKLFIIKFDTKRNPEQETATSVIVNRIFWALGYNVPSDTVFHFCRKDISVSEKATQKNKLNEKIKMTDENLDNILKQSPELKPGCYRASASEFLDGVPKGGFSAEGTRPDDPNDQIPHEHRRVLRALQVFSAWTGHTDIKTENTLDMYVNEGGRKYLKHYLVDFGEALGAHASEKERYEDGWEHLFDWDKQLLYFLSFGLWKRPWEDRKDTKWKSIGPFVSKPFDPEAWKEVYPFWPLHEATDEDLYWATKLIMRFNRADLQAIVKEGQLSNPEASEYLVETLLKRRDAIAKAFLYKVSPLDYFRMKEGRICAVDLGQAAGLSEKSTLQRMDSEGKKVEAEFPTAKEGDLCFPLLKKMGYAKDRLRIVVDAPVQRFLPLLELHYVNRERPKILGLIRKLP